MAELNEQIVAGVNACVATVLTNGLVFDYEPSAVGSDPMAFTLIESWSREQQGQVVRWLYTVATMLIVSHQVPQSERVLAPLVHPIMAAIQSDRTLGGALSNGYSSVTGGEAGWTSVGKVVCRAYRVRTEAFMKVAA